MNSDKLNRLIQDVAGADDWYNAKPAIVNFMIEIYHEYFPPLNLDKPMYVKDDVDLKELCYYFEELDDRFINKSQFGECITVMKNTREVYEYGYDGTVVSWWQEGKLRQ